MYVRYNQRVEIRIRMDVTAATDQAKSEASAQQALTLVENSFLGRTSFVAGTEGVSLADLLCYSEVV
jgi:hypothetical protein